MSRIYAQQKRPGAKSAAPSYTPPVSHTPSMVGGESSGNLDALMQAKFQQHFLDNQIPTAEAEADRIAASVSGARTPEEVKTQLGEKMGADFSNVTFHTDSAALKQADAMGARAYTSGSDVYFGSGGFDPGVAAHELIHTVQQGMVGSAMGTVSAPTGGVQMKPSERWDRFKGLFGHSRGDKFKARYAKMNLKEKVRAMQDMAFAVHNESSSGMTTESEMNAFSDLAGTVDEDFIDELVRQQLAEVQHLTDAKQSLISGGMSADEAQMRTVYSQRGLRYGTSAQLINTIGNYGVRDNDEAFTPAGQAKLDRGSELTQRFGRGLNQAAQNAGISVQQLRDQMEPFSNSNAFMAQNQWANANPDAMNELEAQSAAESKAYVSNFRNGPSMFDRIRNAWHDNTSMLHPRQRHRAVKQGLEMYNNRLATTAYDEVLNQGPIQEDKADFDVFHRAAAAARNARTEKLTKNPFKRHAKAKELLGFAKRESRKPRSRDIRY